MLLMGKGAPDKTDTIDGFRKRPPVDQRFYDVVQVAFLFCMGGVMRKRSIVIIALVWMVVVAGVSRRSPWRCAVECRAMGRGKEDGRSERYARLEEVRPGWRSSTWKNPTKRR